jgi:hypothetical protein
MINRRHFHRTAGSVTALATFTTPTSEAAEAAVSQTQAQPRGFASIRVDGDQLLIETHTLSARMTRGSLMDGMTSTEGMNRLIRHVAGLGNGLVVGGEGLNEITMQGQSFVQAHLFKSWQQSIDGLERTGRCDLNQRLFGRLCRTIGYSGLGGRDDNDALRMNMHLEQGAIPTVTIRSASDIHNSSIAVRS